MPVKDASGVQEAAVPAAGAECVRHPAFVSRPLSLPQIRAASHTLRRFARINVVASYFYSKARACSRTPLYPGSPLSRAHSFGPSRPRPGRRSANRTMSVFVGVWEPKVSQPLCRQSPPSPSRQTTSPATLHFVPRHWWFGDSVPHRPATPETPNHQRPLRDPRFSVSADWNVLPRTRDGKGV